MWEHFSKFVSCDVDIGDGKRIRFWKHVLCGVVSLEERFSDLFYIATNRDSGGVLH